jgi:hypothetical protein
MLVASSAALAISPSQPADVRVTADQGRVQNRRREDVLRVLRQQGKAARNVPARQPCEVLPAQPDASGGGRSQAGQRQQGQRLSGAIASEHRDELAPCQGEPEGIDEDTPGYTYPQILARQQCIFVFAHRVSVAHPCSKRNP